MSSDWRLDANAPGRDFLFAKNAAADAACMARIAREELDRLAGHLVGGALVSIGGGGPSELRLSEDTDPTFGEAARSILKAFGDASVRPEETAEIRVLSAIVIRDLIQRVVDMPDFWIPAFDLASRLPNGWNRFIGDFDIAAARLHQEILFNLPALREPREWVDTYGRLREVGAWASYVEEMHGLQETTRDAWEFIDRVTPYSREIRMSTQLRMKSELARRAGADVWARWLGTLPLPLFMQLELYSLDSLDEAHSLLAEVVNLSPPSPSQAVLAVLVVRRVVELLEQLWMNLARGADPRRTIPADNSARLERYEGALRDWRDRELKERVSALATVLTANDAVGIPTAVLALQHIFVRSGNDYYRQARTATTNAFRTALLEALTPRRDALRALANDLLSAGSPPAAILSAALLLLSAERVSGEEYVAIGHAILAAYNRWTGSPSFFWQTPLHDDDLTLTWNLAGVLAGMPNPSAILLELFERAEVSPEGWKHDWKRFFDSISRFAHILIIGAMASEWLSARNLSGSAIDTFDAAWKSLRRWVRGFPTRTASDDQVSVAIANLWGRLSLVHGAELASFAREGADDLDRLDWILLGCRNAVANLRGSERPMLDVEVQKLIRSHFRRDFSAMRRRYGVPLETLEQFRKWERELTPSLPPLDEATSGP